MTERVKEGALYSDLIAAPADKVAEIIGGDLYLSPRPSPRHSNASSVLGADLLESFQRGRNGPGGWWILDEPELHFSPDVLVPDIAGWRRERLPRLPETAWFELPPDWICEVISASTERIDREEKLPLYLRAAVDWLWLVDPTRRRLEVFRRSEANWDCIAIHSGDAVVNEPPFEAVSIELAPLWT
jgi:Uma2 family endonuclease